MLSSRQVRRINESIEKYNRLLGVEERKHHSIRFAAIQKAEEDEKKKDKKSLSSQIATRRADQLHQLCISSMERTGTRRASDQAA
jgi:hypothetical protein